MCIMVTINSVLSIIQIVLRNHDRILMLWLYHHSYLLYPLLARILARTQALTAERLLD